MIETSTIPKDKLTEIKRQAIQNPLAAMREQVKGGLFKFIRYFWDTYSQDQFITNWHIEKICKELEEIAKRVARKEKNEEDLIINIPPGTTKTAMVSIFFPIWCWVNWYWMRFITSSHSSSLSLESAEYSRDIVRSDKFRQLFPEIEIKQDKDTKSNFQVVKKIFHRAGKTPRLAQGGGRISTSVGSKMYGFHGHIIIWDDLLDPKSDVSDADIAKANKHLKGLSTRKVDKRIAATIGIMQRITQNDPTGYLLDRKDKKIRHICLPGEIKNYKEQLKPREYENYYVDGLLDQNRLGWDELANLMSDLGQYGYAGQVGQKPTPPGGGMFQVEHINILDQFHVHHIVEQVRYWDKAGTEGGGAYTVGAKIAKMKDGSYLVMDIKRGQWSTNKREQIIRETAEADGTKCKIYVEQEPGSGGKESVEGTIRNLAGYNVQADRPTGNKIYRADPYSVQINNGNVRLLRGGWNKEYLDELEHFPHSTYKDQVDASSGAFQKLTSLKKVIVMKR